MKISKHERKWEQNSGKIGKSPMINSKIAVYSRQVGQYSLMNAGFA
jgi:hypothetical protein